ncbi:MAG: hypothetical protein QME51_08405 [Planctomycetota bacterium]|nr:hypothetical protein [Planctomycetota bacterium]MDI6788378.1 hypothetical protein [Planctomycetota bacterium]
MLKQVQHDIILCVLCVFAVKRKDGFFMLSEAKSRRIAGNKWLKPCLVIVLIGVMALTFGGKGCFLQKDESGSSSIVIPIPPVIEELLTNIMGWLESVSANYRNEGGLGAMERKTASSTNHRNEGGLRAIDTKAATSTNYQNETR